MGAAGAGVHAEAHTTHTVHAQGDLVHACIGSGCKQGEYLREARDGGGGGIVADAPGVAGFWSGGIGAEGKPRQEGSCRCEKHRGHLHMGPCVRVAVLGFRRGFVVERGGASGKWVCPE